LGHFVLLNVTIQDTGQFMLQKSGWLYAHMEASLQT